MLIRRLIRANLVDAHFVQKQFPHPGANLLNCA